MKTRELLAVAVITGFAFRTAGQTVVVTGACAPTTVIPAPCYGAAPAVCQTSVRCAVQPVCNTPAYAALAGQYASPNVIYFGGPNSRYLNSYGCRNSSVIYFGRGQAYYGGYAFTRRR